MKFVSTAMTLLVVLGSTLVSAGCSSSRKYKDVTDDPFLGTSVTIRSNNAELALHEAVDEANAYCKDHGGKTATFFDEHGGSAREEKAKAVERANSIGKNAGGDVLTSDVPGVGIAGANLGGVPAGDAMSKSLITQLFFRCH